MRAGGILFARSKAAAYAVDLKSAVMRQSETAESKTKQTSAKKKPF